jgi:hypothetical protein
LNKVGALGKGDLKCASPLRGSPTMAIGANHLASLHLFEDGPPPPLLEPLAYLKALFADMIEFEHNGIGLAAVSAGVFTEVVDQEASPPQPFSPLERCRVLDVTSAIGLIVLAPVSSAAVSTH